MAKRVAPYSCSGCIHLQKEDPIISGQMALYRCTSQKRNGRCVGWVPKDKPDSGLNTQGGSCCNVLCPGDKIKYRIPGMPNEYYFLYCGKLRGRRLIIGIPDHVPHAVENSWFRDLGGKLLKNRYRIVMQSEEQKEFHRRLAKSIVEEYRHGRE